MMKRGNVKEKLVVIFFCTSLFPGVTTQSYGAKCDIVLSMNYYSPQNCLMDVKPRFGPNLERGEGARCGPTAQPARPPAVWPRSRSVGPTGGRRPGPGRTPPRSHCSVRKYSLAKTQARASNIFKHITVQSISQAQNQVFFDSNTEN